ncbi:YchF family ATPase [bacterium]|nr:YchF family ATPase [bacterium]
MNIGLIGPPRSGKTTVFHLLTGTENDPNAAFKHEALHAVTHVPDVRVDKLAELSNSKKKDYVTVEYVDTPGIEEGSSKQNWFEGQVMSEIKNSDALLLIVRDFAGDDVSELHPEKDIRSVQDELVFADFVVIEKRLDKLHRQRKVKPATNEEQHEIAVMERAHAILEEGKPLRLLELDAIDKKLMRGFQCLSEKPILAIVNVADDKLADSAAQVQALNASLADQGINTIALSAQIEGEIALLEGEEREEFMKDLGITEAARDRVLRASFELLGMHSFLTTGDKESRAWPIMRDATAVEAAGVIHTDLAHGFIRAEVVHYDDFVREGGYPGCRDKGLLRLEGKDYIVKDGDVIVIRHSG